MKRSRWLRLVGIAIFVGGGTVLAIRSPLRQYFAVEGPRLVEVRS